MGGRLSIGIVLGLAWSLSGGELRGAGQRPNVIVVVADDLGYGELGCYGGKDAPTPNLDAMAQNGVRFSAGYVTCPVCSPSRAGLLTGKYQQRFGHENNIGEEPEHAEMLGLPQEEQTLAQRLKAAGYVTGAIGKWHLGLTANFHPQERGFDEFFGFLHGAHAYLKEDNFYYRPTPPHPKVFFQEKNRPLYRNQTVVEEPDYLTDAFTREALAFIDRRQTQPFFLYLAYNAVHTPITPCTRWEAKLAHIQDPIRRAVASMTAALDENIGRLRDELRKIHLDRQTLLIFISDNGGSPGGTEKSGHPTNYSLNTPLRGGKGQCWEGGIRIPYIMEWPGRIPAGATCNQAVSALDILPTALAAAGAPPAKDLDGVNLLPFLTSGAAGSPHEALFWRFHIYKAVRKGPLKLLKIRDQPDELYDLGADLTESKNLAAAQPEVVAALNRDLVEWESRTIPPRWNQQFPLRPDGRPVFPRPKAVGPTPAAAPAAKPPRRTQRNTPQHPALSLHDTVAPSALVDAVRGSVAIAGSVTTDGVARVLLRVTTSLGQTAEHAATVQGRAFRSVYPQDFPNAPPLAPGALFVDATVDRDFDVSRAGHFQAEATLLVYDSRQHLVPDLPSAFGNDLLDGQGRIDQQSAEWPVIRALVNRYMHSQTARAAGVGRAAFDLAQPADLAWFKNHLTLYEFDHRDRDWSQPLGQRPARTFWQAVWNAWFNASNDHPRDGNPANRTQANYVPYAFANDFSDSLIMYVMRLRNVRALDDNLQTMCREGTANMLAMQHREPTNFALRDTRGKQEIYTAGAFRYGMFEDGQFMTEGTGWFYNPQSLDYVRGGVFNGRALWALGEALQHDRQSPHAPQIRDALAGGVKFCLHDALALGYAHRTKAGHVYWHDAGEHGYLLLGMLAACKTAPELIVLRAEGQPPLTLREACGAALDALVDLELPHHQWSVYTNKDPLAILALVEGAQLLEKHPHAAGWREAATRVADAWLAAKAPDYPAPLVHFGLRVAPDRMTFNWSCLTKRESDDHNTIHFYLSGHWIHALARLYAVTGEVRYRQRAEAMISYFCGDNPWRGRLFNEVGGVYNWVDDTDGDGIEDWLKQDMYPESTCFCQIGMMHLLRVLAGVPAVPIRLK